jgi:hypothetical protein
MSPDEEQERGFTIVDKRGDEPPASEAQKPAEKKAPEPPEELPPLPTVDFGGLVLSLGTSVMLHLGLVEDPATGATAEPDLLVARHTIDTLEMLEAKTRGNLADEEQELLTNVLTDLRMRFVEVSRSS